MPQKEIVVLPWNFFLQMHESAVSIILIWGLKIRQIRLHIMVGRASPCLAGALDRVQN